MISDKEVDEVATYLEYLTKASSMDAMERHFMVGARHALMDHLVRSGVDVAVQPRRGKATPRDLMNEAERILHRTSGAMSLRDRLYRDAQLRADVMALLRDFEED